MKRLATVLAIGALACTSSPGPMQRERMESDAKRLNRPSLADRNFKEAESMRDQLSAVPDLISLSRLLGSVPHNCQPLDDSSLVCSWDLSNRTQAYKGLAAILETKKRLAVVCDLPVNLRSPREPESCSVAAPGRTSIRF